MQLESLYLNIAHERYHFLKFILEGYDGLCLLSVVPGRKGCVCLRYPDNNRGTLFDLLEQISDAICPSKKHLVKSK